jgi:hypothetical protein
LTDHGESSERLHRPVRSFVLREGRLTAAQQRALTEHWPRYGDDDTIRAISGSSISTAYGPAWSDGFEEGRFVDDGAIHLPPTEEFRRDVIEDRMDLSERFFMHFGTTNDLAGFGAVNERNDGLITPHIHVVDDATFEEVRDVIEQAIGVFEGTVYGGGENVVLSPP